MSALIEGMLAQTVGKTDEETIAVRVADLKVMCSQATARGQMIAIYEELLTYAAEAITTGVPNLDLAGVIVRAISRK
jgi:hypothetical protein